MDAYGLAGGPISWTNHAGEVVDSGMGWLARGDVFRAADVDLGDPEGVSRLLWYSIAWGAGPNRRLCDKRMRSVRDDRSRVLAGLSEAVRLCTTPEGVGSAYEVLCPRSRRNLIPYLGPAFATKFLYFAGAGAEDHSALILDSVVANVLRFEIGWESLSPKGAWPRETYIRYCDLLRRWASELSDSHRTVSADEIERALFALGRSQSL